MRVWKFATSRQRGSQSSELCKQRLASRRCLVSSCLWNLIYRQTSRRQRSDAEGEGAPCCGQYNVLIINRRLSQCRHPLLGQQHPAPFLPARPSELSKSSLYEPHVVCFIQLSILSQSMRCQLRTTSVLATLQTRQHVSHVLQWGSTYMRVLNFGRFFSLKVRESTYMRIVLYAGIYGSYTC